MQHSIVQQHEDQNMKEADDNQVRGDVLLVKRSAARCSDSSSIVDSEVSSNRSGRRPSIDTVSTYLSHDSELRASQVRLIINTSNEKIDNRNIFFTNIIFLFH